MDSSIAIRLLTPDDAAAFSQLRHEALETEPQAYGASLEEHHAISLEQIRARLRTTADANFVVGAFEDTTLVGTAGFRRENRPKTKHKGVIWGVYVQSTHRGRGIGRALMHAVLERARTYTDVRQIVITATVTQHAAQHLYASLGFQRWGLEPDALKIGDAYIDEEWMLLRLTD